MKSILTRIPSNFVEMRANYTILVLVKFLFLLLLLLWNSITRDVRALKIYARTNNSKFWQELNENREKKKHSTTIKTHIQQLVHQMHWMKYILTSGHKLLQTVRYDFHNFFNNKYNLSNVKVRWYFSRCADGLQTRGANCLIAVWLMWGRCMNA